jgi:hypothetical protein
MGLGASRPEWTAAAAPWTMEGRELAGGVCAQITRERRSERSLAAQVLGCRFTCAETEGMMRAAAEHGRRVRARACARGRRGVW